MVYPRYLCFVDDQIISDFRIKRFILPYLRFPQQWNWEFWHFGMSRYVAGLISPDVSKGTVSTLSLFMYLCVIFHILHCLFGWSSRLGLMPLPNPRSSVTWSTPSPKCPWLVFNYMHWNASFCMMWLWLTIFLCSNFCYSYLKKNSPCISSLLILSCVPHTFLENCGFCRLTFYIQYQECHREQIPTSERGKQKPQHNNSNAK